MKRLRLLGTGLIGALLLALLVWSAPLSGQSVSSQLRLQLSIIDQLAVGLTTVTVPFDKDYTQLLSSGTGANQANAMYQASRTLAASATENLDLNASLTDVHGQSVTCTKLKALVIKAAASNTNTVLVGGGATTVTTLFTNSNDQLIVRPGGVFIFTAPDATGAAVTAGATVLLVVMDGSSGTAVTYDVVVLCVE